MIDLIGSLYFIGRIIGGDFAKFCGLLRIYELYCSRARNLTGPMIGLKQGPLKKWTEHSHLKIHSRGGSYYTLERIVSLVRQKIRCKYLVFGPFLTTHSCLLMSLVITHYAKVLPGPSA